MADIESWTHDDVKEWMKQRRGFSAKVLKKFGDVNNGVTGEFLMSPNLEVTLQHRDLDFSLCNQTHILKEVKNLKKQAEKCIKGEYM